MAEQKVKTTEEPKTKAKPRRKRGFKTYWPTEEVVELINNYNYMWDNRLLDEKARRRYLGYIYKISGYGSMLYLTEKTGAHRDTIKRGFRELSEIDPYPERTRNPGAGRKKGAPATQEKYEKYVDDPSSNFLFTDNK